MRASILALAVLGAGTGVTLASDVDVADLGRSVARELADGRGNRFVVTVTPPADRAVDVRFLRSLEIVEPGAVASAAKGEASGGEPVDVSGYRVDVTPLARAGCTLDFAIKSKPVTLGGGKKLVVTAPGTPEMTFGTVYPTKGDVDVYILTDGSTVCSKGTAGAGRLDVAACGSTGVCVNSSTGVVVEFRNFSASAQATYVSMVHVIYVD